VFISAPLQKRRSATHCNTLPHTATYQFDTHFTLVLIWRSREKEISLWRSLLLFRQRDTLQHAARRCNTLQHTATHQLRISLWRSHLLLRKKDTLATHCDTMQQTATHCNPPPQHTNPEFLCGGSIYFSAKETRCNTLQHTATYCNTPKRSFFVEESSAPPQKRHTCDTLRHTIMHYNIPHHTTATNQFGVSWWRSHLLLRKRDTLQYTATHCNTLQHTATYCNTTARYFFVEESSTPPQKSHYSKIWGEHFQLLGRAIQVGIVVLLCKRVSYSCTHEFYMK